MFASLIANWWYGRGVEEAKEEEQRQKKKEKRVDEDGLTEDEEEADEEMPEIRKRFRAAESYLPRVTEKLGAAALLRMYGLYKAATVGAPDPADRPSFFDRKGRAKFGAWQAAAQLTKKEAMREYADKLEAANVGFDPAVTASTSGGFGMRMSTLAAATGDMIAKSEWDRWVDAAKNDDVEAVKRILAANPAIMLQRGDATGCTGMHWAADSGSVEVCAYLLSVQPSLVAELDYEGNQPLHLAAICGFEKTVLLLLDAGASPTLKNYEDESAIDVAYTDGIKEALEKRADALEANGEGDEEESEEEEEDDEEMEQDHDADKENVEMPVEEEEIVPPTISPSLPDEEQ